MMFFLANLSISDETSLSRASASGLEVVATSFLEAVRAVLCWYRLSTRFFSLDLILFSADLWFAISLFYKRTAKVRPFSLFTK